jgi:hypothetical protein
VRMALSWNEIKDRALKFTLEWKDESREHAEAKSFWDAFFNVFGISRRRVASFEEPVKKLNNQYGFIDLFWKGTLLVEHKSRGKDLDRAYTQALDYFSGLQEHELPKYVLVSDFERFRLYDLDENEQHEFHISDFHDNIKLFGFIAGYQKRSFKEEDPVNIKAAELMGKLHDQLKDSGYAGHPLEVYLVRLLFSLFADDTGIFEKDTFKEFIELKTREDGSDLGAALAQFFQVLNTPREKRQKNLDEHLNQFPYVNGKLFEEPLPIAAFESKLRAILLRCCGLDWGKISPAIFGSLFQSVMNPQERRNLGAHYTSEKNILKLIKPLFLDDLWTELKKIESNRKKLEEFHIKIASLKFLDPACGCGNFLVITYREIRLLELAVLRELYKGGQLISDLSLLVQVDVDQFYGIEIDEWPARIAEVALWLMDHQMNLLISNEFGQYYARLPLRKAATIVQANALRVDWENVVPKNELNYILGNPPFYGAMWLNNEQRLDVKLVMGHIKSSGVLDYVACWYIKAVEFITSNSIKIAFVSTNSITQGEQVGILWNQLFNNHAIKIHFAHQTFKWNNEAKDNAAVHVVIVGFSNYNIREKRLFSYADLKSEPTERTVENISGYLVSGTDIIIQTRKEPFCDVPRMIWGSQPRDGGHFILSPDEKKQLLNKFPEAQKYVHLFLGGRELINNLKRYCLWLVGVNPSELKKFPDILERINGVRNSRLASRAPSTRKFAETPTLFAQIAQPNSGYLAIPEVSSERRKYIPIGFLSKEVIASNKIQMLPNATIFQFGILTSEMHNTWMKYTCGRLKSDFSYSNSLVYNNYPWPDNPSAAKIKRVEEKAQAVLDARAQFPDSSLADLYDPLTMPPVLVKAHQALDKAVDLCYRPQPFPNETTRIEYLFELYNHCTAGLFREEKKKRRK